MRLMKSGKGERDSIQTRKELPLATFLSEARSRICFLGLSLDNLSSENMGEVRGMLKRGVHITFLVLSPSSPLITEVERAVGASNLVDTLNASLGILHRIRNELSDPERDRLEVRTYDLMPLNSMVCLDPNSGDAAIQVEYFLHGTDPQSRPCHIITKKEQAELFSKHWDSYLFILERSKDIPYRDPRPQPIKDLMMTLAEFQSSWNDRWRKLIEATGLRSPENREILQYSDRVRRILAQVDAEVVRIKPELKVQVREFAEEASVFGDKIHTVFPDQGTSIAAYISPIKEKLLQQGDAMAEKLDGLIQQISEGFSLRSGEDEHRLKT